MQRLHRGWELIVKKRSRIRKAVINICNTVRFSFAEEIFFVQGISQLSGYHWKQEKMRRWTNSCRRNKMRCLKCCWPTIKAYCKIITTHLSPLFPLWTPGVIIWSQALQCNPRVGHTNGSFSREDCAQVIYALDQGVAMKEDQSYEVFVLWRQAGNQGINVQWIRVWCLFLARLDHTPTSSRYWDLHCHKMLWSGRCYQWYMDQCSNPSWFYFGFSRSLPKPTMNDLAASSLTQISSSHLLTRFII